MFHVHNLCKICMSAGKAGSVYPKNERHRHFGGHPGRGRLQKVRLLPGGKDENEILLIEQWETKNHQQVHMTQPHMAKMKEFKGDYIANTVLGEVEIK